jgi:lipopolysaccharide biosynthesis regulator YciM
MDFDFPRYYVYILIAIVVIFLFVVTLLLRRNKNTRTRPPDPYVEALKKLIGHDLGAAYSLLQQAVKRGNAPTDAYIKLGELLRENGEVVKALQIHQSLTVKTNLTRDEKAELFKNIALDYSQLGKPARAAGILESAIKTSHFKQAEMISLLAGQYHKLGQTDKAFDTLRELKRLDQINDRELALYLASAGENSLAAEDVKTARKYLQKALKLDPDCPTALFVLGDLEAKNGRGEEAIGLWKKTALASEDLAGPALEHLQKILFNEGKFGELEQINLDILARRAGDEAASLALAQFYQKQGREDDALQLLEEFTAGNQDSMGATVLLTSLYSKRGDHETLESFLNQAINRDITDRGFVCSSCNHKNMVMRWHCPECNSFDSFNSDHAD